MNESVCCEMVFSLPVLLVRDYSNYGIIENHGVYMVFLKGNKGSKLEYINSKCCGSNLLSPT